MRLAEAVRWGLDAAAFASEALGFESDPWQSRVLRSTARRQLLCCSRQSGKSTTAAALALHQAVSFPGSLVLLLSPSLRQSSELFRKVGAFHRGLKDGPEVLEDNKLSLELANRSRIVSLPGSEETVRGFSAVSLAVVDEAARVPDELYRSIRPMLAVSNGRLIGMSSPFGRRGWFWEAWNGPEDWERVRVPASECPRISADFLEQERRGLGEWWFQQEYCCEFLDATNQLFSYGDVMGAVTPTVRPLAL